MSAYCVRLTTGSPSKYLFKWDLIMRQIKQFLTLSEFTAIEIIRQPIYLLLTTACVILTALVPVILMHQFGEDGKLVRDSGLAFHFVFGIFVAGYAACSSLSKEIKNSTALTVLSKPVGRETFFLAKYAGIIVVVAIFSMCATITTLLSERVAQKFYYNKIIGYFTDWQTGGMLIAAPFVAYLLAGFINYKAKHPFGTTAIGLLLFFLLIVFFISGFFDRTGHFAPFNFYVKWRIVPVSLLITMALVVFSAIALTLSTILGTAPTLTICSIVFLIGLMSDFLFGADASNSLLASFFYKLIPNWQHFWVSDSLNKGGSVPWMYMLNAGFYAIMYSMGILCLGTLSFRHTEM